MNRIWEKRLSGQELTGPKSAIKYLRQLEYAADSLKKQIELIKNIKDILETSFG